AGGVEIGESLPVRRHPAGFDGNTVHVDRVATLKAGESGTDQPLLAPHHVAGVRETRTAAAFAFATVATRTIREMDGSRIDQHLPVDGSGLGRRVLVGVVDA